jgi:hypothetical protein
MSDKPYVVQVGRAKIGSQITEHKTEALARSFMLRSLKSVEPFLRKYNSAGLGELQVLRADITYAIFDFEPSVVQRQVDPTIDFYFKIWRRP